MLPAHVRRWKWAVAQCRTRKKNLARRGAGGSPASALGRRAARPTPDVPKCPGMSQEKKIVSVPHPPPTVPKVLPARHRVAVVQSPSTPGRPNHAHPVPDRPPVVGRDRPGRPGPGRAAAEVGVWRAELSHEP